MDICIYVMASSHKNHTDGYAFKLVLISVSEVADGIKHGCCYLRIAFQMH